MKTINLNEEVKNINGDVVRDKVKVEFLREVEGEFITDFRMEEKTLTVGMMLTQAVLKRDSEISEEQLLKRMSLLDKLINASEVDLTDAEISFLKELIINRFDVFFAGTLIRLLN